MSELVGFFRSEGAAFGHKGDYEMWTPEQTAIHFLREHLHWARSPDERPIPMVLTCPSCGGRHLDEGEFATKAHHTHACQYCGMVWRPAIVATVGVQFLPGFKNEAASGMEARSGETAKTGSTEGDSPTVEDGDAQPQDDPR